MAKESKINLKLNLIDGVSAQLNKINNAFERSGLGRLGTNIQNFNKGISQAFNQVGRLGIELVAIGYTAKRAFDFFVAGPIEAADSLGDLSQATSFSVKEIQILRRVFDDFGISAEQTDGALVKFNVSLGQLRTNQGKLYQFLNKSNTALLDQLKNAKSGDEAFRSFADALFDVKDMSVRASIAAIAFGRGNSKIAGALGKTREEFQKLIKDKSSLPFISEEDAKRAGEAEEKLKDLSTQFSVLKTQIGLQLLPVVVETFSSLLKFLNENRDTILKIIKNFGDLITNTTVLKTALAGLAILISTRLLSAVITIGRSIWLAFGPLGIALAAFLATSILIYDQWDNIVSKFKEAYNWMKNLFGFGDGPLTGQSTNQPTRGEFSNFLANNNLLPQSSSAAPAKAEVNVSFSDMPKGARVEETKNTGVDLGLLYGFRNYSMP